MRIYFCGQSIKHLFVLSLEVALVLVTIFWILDSFFVIVCQGLVDPDRLNETCLSYGPRRLTSSLVQLEAEELQTLAETSPSYLVIIYRKPRSQYLKYSVCSPSTTLACLLACPYTVVFEILI